MRCPYCHRPLRLLDRKHPTRLLAPRCRICRRYSLGPAHKVVLTLLALIILYLLTANLLPLLIRK
jgi:hypothetical protein